MLKPLAVLALVVLLAGVGCGGRSGTSKDGGGSAESGSAATGDIPDNQVFLVFRGPGYSLKYPEGWTKKGSGQDLTFSDKDNSIHLVERSGNAPAKVTNGRVKIKLRRLGPPNPVTGKRPLLLVDRYVYAKGGKYAVLDLATPKGVDNVDAYRLISNSFRWQ